MVNISIHILQLNISNNLETWGIVPSFVSLMALAVSLVVLKQPGEWMTFQQKLLIAFGLAMFLTVPAWLKWSDFFKGHKRFLLDIVHKIVIILLCEATEISKRSRMESQCLIWYSMHYVKLCYSKLTHGATLLILVRQYFAGSSNSLFSLLLKHWIRDCTGKNF